MKSLTDKLNYQFTDPKLLVAALTHPSYGSDHSVPHYQRLEFLGDAVLQLAVTRLLFDQYTGVDEGRLTRARAAIVCEASLYEAAKHISLGDAIYLSVGEERSGGRDKPSILSDALEAVFAAVYLDGGMEEATRVIRTALGRQLTVEAADERVDYKSQLQIRLQKEKGADPIYRLTGAEGAPHMPQFTMQVLLLDQVLGEGTGRSKQAAQQRAAQMALEKLVQGTI